MPRPTTPLRVSQFLGFDDSLPVEIGETNASALENLYRVGKTLTRRAGQSALGSAALSPDQDLNLLSWNKIGDTEHLVGVHNTNVVDFLDASVGMTVGNGAGKFTAGGATADVNATWLDDQVYLGNGVDQNVVYNGAAGSSDLAAQFTGASIQYLTHANNATFQMGNFDFTIAGWARMDSTAFRRPIAAVYDVGTATDRAFRLYYDVTDSRWEFGIRNDAGAGFEGNVHADPLVPLPNVWYFVVGTYNATTHVMSISVNAGVPNTLAGPAGGTNVGTAPFYIGAIYNSATPIDVMDGRIARVGFWKTAAGGSGAGCLTTGQINTLYNNGRGFNYAHLPGSLLPGLVGYWDLTETTGTRADGVGANNLTASVSSPTSAQGVDYVVAVTQVLPDTVTNGSFAAAQTTTGSLTLLGAYQYKVSFLSATGNPGVPGDALAITLTGSNRKVNLSNIPVCGAGQDCSGRRLWRTTAGGATFFMLADISDNTTTTYADTAADTALGDELVTTNVRFPPCRYLIEHQNRMLGAHCATAEGDLQTVYISNTQEPWYSPEVPDLEDPTQGTRAVLQGRAAGEITGLCSHGGIVAVFTGAAGHLLLGVEPNDFRIQKFCDHGATAHRTIVSVRSLLLWLAPDGVYQWDGQHTVRISEDVRTTIEALTATQMAQAHALVWRDRYYLFWTGGCLWYDLNFRIWGKLTNNTWRTSTVTAFTSSALQRIYVSYYGHARVYQIETGATDSIPSSPTAITARWASRDWDMGLAARDKRVHYIEAKFKKGTGTATVTLYRGTGESIQTISYDLSTVDNAADTVSRCLKGANEYARDEHFRLEMSCATTAAELILLAMGLHWTLAS